MKCLHYAKLNERHFIQVLLFVLLLARGVFLINYIYDNIVQDS